MSHHFDNPNARDDPRLNVNDFYLFPGGPGRTVMAMTVCPDAGVSSPDTLRDEGLYAMRLDLDGDNVEEVTFKFRFSAPFHGAGGEHTHLQTYDVRRATGGDAQRGADGKVIAQGVTGQIVSAGDGVLTFVGLAPDLFAGDGAALGRFKAAFHEQDKFMPAVFENAQNRFAKRNVVAIVLELPTEMIGQGQVRAWATSSLHGHAPEIQVCRWGWPLFTHIFLLPDTELSEAYNRGAPADDVETFGSHVADIGKRLTTLAGSAADPDAYGRRLAMRLLPSVLPYDLDTPAAFDFLHVNGRGLLDDVMDVNLTQATNVPLADGVAPDPARVRPDFPYFGRPYSPAEQSGVAPAIKSANA
jgi:hypothetical protein